MVVLQKNMAPSVRKAETTAESWLTILFLPETKAIVEAWPATQWISLAARVSVGKGLWLVDSLP
jgi:hypothetical protein